MVHTISFVSGYYYRQFILQEISQHKTLGGINYCSIMIGVKNTSLEATNNWVTIIVSLGAFSIFYRDAMPSFLQDLIL